MKAIIGLKSSIFKLIAVLLCLSTASSCVNLMHLDRAQNQFNQGASIENELRFNPQTDAIVSPSLLYNSAYAAVNKALEDKAGLEKDDVLANAYTIKAFCEWKLKRYTEATQTSKLALEALTALEGKRIFMTRDKILMEALPHLIEIEEVKNDLYKFHAANDKSYLASFEHYQQVVFDSIPGKTAKLEGAIQKIDNIANGLVDSKDLSVYFISSRLAALKTWSDALDFLRQRINGDSSITQANKAELQKKRLKQREKEVITRKGTLLEQLETLLSGQEGEALIAYWRKLF